MSDIPNLDLDEITTSQLAIDAEIEQSQVTNLQGHLKPDANCPDFLQLKWWFLSCQFALVPGTSGFYVIQKVHFDSFAGWSESNYDFKLLQSGRPGSDCQRPSRAHNRHLELIFSGLLRAQSYHLTPILKWL
jgi:hypothetical protein